MTATVGNRGRATHATAPALDFDVIIERVAEIRKVPKEGVSDAMMAEFFSLHRATIGRFRQGLMKPSLPTALAMAAELGLSIYEIQAGNPTPKPPSGPAPTPRPANPPTPSKPSKA